MDKLDKFVSQCDALNSMVQPTGFVSAQEYQRLLKVTKQLRKVVKECLDSDVVDDAWIRIPKSKKIKSIDPRLRGINLYPNIAGED